MSGDVEPTSGLDVLLDGKYRLGRMLGAGAFSWVFEATHVTVDGLEYAVKVLKNEHVDNEDSERRFNLEVRTLAAMQSPYTVRVSDAGRTGDGNPYLVMEKLAGVTLRELVVAEGPVHELHAAQFAKDVLRGLRSAHEAGVVHRDLKPSNIFIVDRGIDGRAGAKVVDFGIAKILGTSFLREPEHESTVDGTPCTPTYAAPEQLHQEPTVRSDLYALGHVMAYMLDGHAPYSGTGAFAVIAQHMSNDPVPLAPAVQRSALVTIVAKACEKDQRQRWSSAEEMLAALEPVIATLETTYPLLSGPRIPARLNFAGSGDFTVPDTWSVMSVGGPTKDAKRERPVSNLPPDPETALVSVKSSANPRTMVLVIAAVFIALIALVIALARSPAAVPSPDDEMLSMSSPEIPQRPSPEREPDAQTVADLSGAVSRARVAVADAVAVPAEHRWTVSARDGAAGTVHIVMNGEEGPGSALPLVGAFGPATRPVRLIVRLAGGSVRETVEEPGAVELTGLRISRPQSNDSPEPVENTPRPGSLSIRRP